MRNPLRNAANVAIIAVEGVLNTISFVLHPAENLNPHLDDVRCRLVGHQDTGDCIVISDKTLCYCDRCGTRIREK